MTSRSAALLGTTRAEWEYVASPGPTGPEQRRERRTALESVLRAGHGAGARWALEFNGGRAVSRRLRVEDASSERWVNQLLTQVYAGAGWHRRPPDVPGRPVARWTGRRRGLPGDPANPPPEFGQLAAALAQAVEHGGGAARLTLRLRPAPPPRFGWLDLWEPRPAPPAPGAVRSRRALPAPGPPGAPAPPGSLLWSAAIDLVWSRGAAGRGPGPPLDSVRSAWTALDGRPLVLAPAHTAGIPKYATLLTLQELLSLFPHGGEPGEGRAPTAESAEGLAVGRSTAGTTVVLPVDAREGRHFAVLGETGMGKSSLLVSVAARAARLGGLLLLDPIGETAERVRTELERAGRELLWIAPETPGVGANALAGVASALTTDPVRAERELDGLVHALRRVRSGRFADAAYWGPRIEEMLGRALRAAASLDGGTLEDAYTLLGGVGAGRRVVPAEASSTVRELLGRVRDRPEDAEGARRLLYEIVRNPTLSSLLAARTPQIDLTSLVAPGSLVLVSGAAPRVGEATARYLLATYLALVWAELLARDGQPKTFVILDEAQWFGHEALGEMLRLARRCNVHVGLATQSLASLPEPVREAVQTNVADTVAFRGASDAGHGPAREARPLPADLLLGLSRGEAIALVGQGERRYRIRTARLPEPPARAGTRLPHPEAHRLGPADGPASLGTPLGRAAAGALRAPSGEAGAPGAVAGGSARLVEVDVGRLRAAAGESAVRALGSELGRSGAIVRSERRPTGSVWWVRREALAGRTVPGSGPTAAAASSPTKRL
jgi:hypothetical protein